MAGLMEQLIGVLSDQLPNYDALISLSELKKDIIVANNAEALQKITSEENTIVGRAQKLDKNRMALMHEIGIVLNITDTAYTLTDLCELIKGQDEYDTLLGLIETSREKLDALREINNQNKELIQNSLDYIDFSVNVMRSQVHPDKQFYNTSGDEIAPGSGFFDAWQ